MAEPILDVHSIFEILHRTEVRYVVIGGMAGVLHGSPVATNDLDICPARDDENLERLAAALAEMDALIYTQSESEGLSWARDAEALKQASIWNLITPYGRLDISFQPSGTRGYQDLSRSAVTHDLDEVSVRVASVLDVIRSKEAVGREKDQRGLIALRKLLEHIEEKE